MNEMLYNDENWKRVQKPYASWNLLAYYVVAIWDPNKSITEEQSKAFDFAWAAMMQQDYGYE